MHRHRLWWVALLPVLALEPGQQQRDDIADDIAELHGVEQRLSLGFRLNHKLLAGKPEFAAEMLKALPTDDDSILDGASGSQGMVEDA
jgi:hypothetical protein